MYSLILKDFLMLRRMLLLIAAFVALFYSLQNPPILAISLAGFLFVSSVGNFEDRNNAHIMLNSLAISRKIIISSKYMGAILFGIFAIALATLFQIIYYWFGFYYKPLPEASQLLMGMLCILLFTAIYLPILYKFGEKYTRIIYMFILVGSMVFGQILMYTIKDEINNIQVYLGHFTDNQLLFSGSIITIVLFLLSWIYSIKVYEAKDF
jgi:ABC-2 type transport system permease protein